MTTVFTFLHLLISLLCFEHPFMVGEIKSALNPFMLKSLSNLMLESMNLLTNISN